jgi:hypothetical protein
MSGCGRREIRRLRVDGRLAIAPCIGSNQAKVLAIRSDGDPHRLQGEDAAQSDCRVQAKPQRHASPNKGHRHERAPVKIGAQVLIDFRESRLRRPARSLSMQRNSRASRTKADLAVSDEDEEVPSPVQPDSPEDQIVKLYGPIGRASPPPNFDGSS